MRHKALKMMILLVTLLAIGLPSKSDNCILSSPVKIIVYPSKNIKGDRVSRPEYLSGFRQRDFRPVVIQSSDSVSRLMKLLDTLEQAGKAPLNSKSDGNFLTIDSTGFHWNAVKEKIEYLIIILTDKADLQVQSIIIKMGRWQHPGKHDAGGAESSTSSSESC